MLAMSGCPDTQIRKVELALGPLRFDTATDRPVHGPMRVAKQDLEAWQFRVYSDSHDFSLLYRMQMADELLGGGAP